MTFYCLGDTCDGETKVMQTSGVHRRRKCLSCGKLFLTEEIEYELPVGTRSPFTFAQEERKVQTRPPIHTQD